MPTPNGDRSDGSRRDPIKGRAILRDAFRYAIKKANTNHTAAARWLGVSSSTVRRWLAGTHRMDVEVVVESRKLGRHFCSCLALAERQVMRKLNRGEP